MKGSERVLFVDDEGQIVDAIGEGLNDFGYEVIGVKDSFEALNIFRANPKIFDIIIIDQTMPGLLGSDLGKEIMKIRKEIPIIICTGYSDNLDRERAMKMGFREFVVKPTTSANLALLIRKIMDKKD